MPTTQLPKLESLIEIAKKKGASEVEVIQKSWTSNPISFENNNLKSLESNESSGIGIRLIKNGKIGIASSTDPSTIEETVTSAIEASEFGPEAIFKFSKDALNKEVMNQTLKPDIPLEQLVERGNKVIDSLKTFHSDLLISGGFDLSYGNTSYINSNGVYGERKKSLYSASFYANLIRGEDFLGIYEGNNSLENFPDEEELKNKILEKLNFSKNNVSIDTKKYTVIFTQNAVSSIFASIFSVLFNGKVIQQGISPLGEKLGQKLFDENLSFIEDPSIGTSKTAFDDEGIKTEKKELIKNGVVNSFYFDLLSGTKYGKKGDSPSTGNGFKGGLSLAPSPSLTTTVIETNGKMTMNEMIKNTKEGILIDHVLGAGQSNTLAGEFNVGIELGFKIENGQIKGRIKNCMVAGNIFELLKDIKEISSDREWIYGGSLHPAFLLEGLTVAGK